MIDFPRPSDHVPLGNGHTATVEEVHPDGSITAVLDYTVTVDGKPTNRARLLPITQYVVTRFIP